MNSLDKVIEKLKELWELTKQETIRDYLFELSRVNLYDVARTFDTPLNTIRFLRNIDTLIGTIDLWPCEYCGYNQKSELSELGNSSLNDWTENHCTSCQVIDWMDDYDNRVHTNEDCVNEYVRLYLGENWQDRLKKWLDEN